MNDSIYFYQNQNDLPSIYINLFVFSQLDWIEEKLSFQQITAFLRETTTNITLTTFINQISIKIYLRVPSWIISNESWIEINDILQDIHLIPSIYIHLPKTNWKINDRIVCNIARHLHMEAINDNPNLVSILYGPIVLSGLINHGKLLSNNVNLIRKMSRTTYEPLLFETTALDGTIFQLIPLYKINNEIYTVYFPIN